MKHYFFFFCESCHENDVYLLALREVPRIPVVILVRAKHLIARAIICLCNKSHGLIGEITYFIFQCRRVHVIIMEPKHDTTAGGKYNCSEVCLAGERILRMISYCSCRAAFDVSRLSSLRLVTARSATSVRHDGLRWH